MPKIKKSRLRRADWFLRIHWLLTRSASLFLLLYSFSLMLVDYNKVETGTKMRSLAYFKPSAFKPMAEFLNSEQPMELVKWKEYHYYYEKYTHYLPQSSDAFILLGFSYYHLGDQKRALESFARASAISKEVFWPHYNSGVIYFEKKLFAEAIVSLKEAIGKNPADTLAFMDTSRNIYIPILKEFETDSLQLKLRLKSAYKDSYVLLAASHFYLQHFAELQKVAEYAIKARVGEPGRFYFYAGVGAFYQKDYLNAAGFFKESIEEHWNTATIKKFLKDTTGQNDLLDIKAIEPFFISPAMTPKIF